MSALGELFGKAGAGREAPTKIVVQFVSERGEPMERDAKGMPVESASPARPI